MGFHNIFSPRLTSKKLTNATAQGQHHIGWISECLPTSQLFAGTKREPWILDDALYILEDSSTGMGSVAQSSTKAIQRSSWDAAS